MANQLILPRCPHCGIASPLLTPKWQLKKEESVDNIYWGIFICTTCKKMVTVMHRDQSSNTWGGNPLTPTALTVVYPTDFTADPSIPDAARRHLTDAINSKSTPSSSVLLAASAVDAMLQAAGYLDDTLNAKIAHAARDNRLTPEMAQWAHSIRMDSNLIRHADHSQPPPTAEDADACIKFANALAEYLYVLPSRVQREVVRETSDTA